MNRAGPPALRQDTALTRQEGAVGRCSATDIFHSRVSAREDLALGLAGPFSIETRYHATKEKKTAVNSSHVAHM